ncbi:MAG: hypothetical protein ACR2KI_07510 [Candidatus Limnocylindria bacterium]
MRALTEDLQSGQDIAGVRIESLRVSMRHEPHRELGGEMTIAPRTVAGRALTSAMRPHLKRAFSPTIVAIEAEAVAPYLHVLGEVDRLMEDLAAKDASAAWGRRSRVDLVKRAQAAHRAVGPLLALARD